MKAKDWSGVGGLERLKKELSKFFKQEQIKQKPAWRPTTPIVEKCSEERARREEDNILKKHIISQGQFKAERHDMIIEKIVAEATEEKAEGRKLMKEEEEMIGRWGKQGGKKEEVEMAKLARKVIARQIQRAGREQRNQRLQVWQAQAKAGGKDPRYASVMH